MQLRLLKGLISRKSTVNHENIVTQISKALVDIAEILPRTELSSHFQSEALKATLGDLYEALVGFLLLALNFLKQSKIRHTLSSIVRPSELRYKEFSIKIENISTRMKNETLRAEWAALDRAKRSWNLKTLRAKRSLHVCSYWSRLVKGPLSFLYNDPLYSAQNETF